MDELRPDDDPDRIRCSQRQISDAKAIRTLPMKDPVRGKDIIIIGAGIGGLSTGILLLLLGYRVTVVEKNSRPGGLMRSYLRGGVDCPVGVHYVGALGPSEPLGKMFHVLGISVEDLFYPMGSSGLVDRYRFDDFVFDMPLAVGMDAAMKEISGRSVLRKVRRWIF